MHLSDGEIRAYLDDQIDRDELPRIAAHLASCSRCQEKQAGIVRTGAQVREHLSALDPAKESHPLSFNQARARLAARIQKKESNSMLNKLFSKQMRPAWIALAVIAVLAISLTFAPVRAIANNFLGLFRVEQFAIVQVNPADFPQQFGSSTLLEAMLAEDVQVEERGEPITLEDKQQASQYVNFNVRLPAGMNSFRTRAITWTRPGTCASSTCRIAGNIKGFTCASARPTMPPRCGSTACSWANTTAGIYPSLST